MNAVERWLNTTIQEKWKLEPPLVSVRLGRPGFLVWRRKNRKPENWQNFFFREATPAKSILEHLKNHGSQRIDVLHLAAKTDVLETLETLDLATLDPGFIHIDRRYLPGATAASAVRFLSRKGYAIHWFEGEFVAVHPERSSNPATGTEPAPSASASGKVHDAAVYVISMDTPEQFRLWLDSADKACPDLLACKSLVLLDNSTDPATHAVYDALCRTYGFTVLREGNLGIMGGRRRCARHFEDLGSAGGMFWFEDDMLLHASTAPLCRNGFRSHVAELVETVQAVSKREGLSFLMLSFTEYFGDHHLNWAWYHLDNETREKDFPDGTFPSSISHGGVAGGTSYLVGNVHFDNWPSYVSREFNREMFLDDEAIDPVEGQYMAKAYHLVRSGKHRAGVLLASPIHHHRRFTYDSKNRIE